MDVSNDFLIALLRLRLRLRLLSADMAQKFGIPHCEDGDLGIS